MLLRMRPTTSNSDRFTYGPEVLVSIVEEVEHWGEGVYRTNHVVDGEEGIATPAP